MFLEKPEGVQISLYVQPGASKSEIVGIHNGMLKIKIKSPPVDGKANEEVIRFLSEILTVPKKNVELIKGDKSREKKVFVHGLKLESAKSLLP
jgi:uncharacterized protein (TIGR00251 family)